LIDRSIDGFLDCAHIDLLTVQSVPLNSNI